MKKQRVGVRVPDQRVREQRASRLHYLHTQSLLHIVHVAVHAREERRVRVVRLLRQRKERVGAQQTLWVERNAHVLRLTHSHNTHRSFRGASDELQKGIECWEAVNAVAVHDHVLAQEEAVAEMRQHAARQTRQQLVERLHERRQRHRVARHGAVAAAHVHTTTLRVAALQTNREGRFGRKQSTGFGGSVLL